MGSAGVMETPQLGPSPRRKEGKTFSGPANRYFLSAGAVREISPLGNSERGASPMPLPTRQSQKLPGFSERGQRHCPVELHVMVEMFILLFPEWLPFTTCGS